MTSGLRPLLRGRARATALAAAVALAATVVGAWGAPSAEATSYRFWSYWTGGDGWTFASQGASRHPADGSVDGWRFAISPASSSTIPPRYSSSFARLCRGTPSQDGMKRVGLVVDFGTAEDAPGGESPPDLIATCATVPVDANGYDVLMTVAQLRTDTGLICGINGYPATECGAPVADPTTSPTQPSGGGGSDSADNAGGNGTGSSGGGTNGGGTTSPTPAATGSGSAAPGSDTKQGGNGRQHQQGERANGRGSSAAATPQVDDESPVAAAAVTSPGSPGRGSPWGVVVGLVVIVAVGAATVVVARRRG